MRNLIGFTLFLLGIAVAIGTPILQAALWLIYAEWINLDIFSLYSALAIDGLAAGADSCWPWHTSPIENARCHALAAASFRAWADSELNAKGLILLIEWLGDLSLFWHGILLMIFGVLSVGRS